ncbi:hypothetical protein P43SY_002632 [Pythium insidiosum]|uniref:CTLH domain-containing protein n=1 Tax=Pythium insidiosum TaxID=114742 RepID=A0AAD5MA89_PYTIN|nr:hypothetical protein P43SY_002632 [Pythium insidiosum]KAJ0412763.1 hypothetical protein ATCC90586_002393 [Pythium insidiosum]
MPATQSSRRHSARRRRKNNRSALPMRGLGPLQQQQQHQQPARSAGDGDGRRMRVSKEWMNRLVMDYLIGRGYRDVAEAFWRDSGTKPHVDLQSVQARMRIHQLLLNGEIAQARDKLLHIDATFIDRNGSIGFLLAKQEMIELIKRGQVMAALTFATQHLAPFGEKN